MGLGATVEVVAGAGTAAPGTGVEGTGWVLVMAAGLLSVLMLVLLLAID